MKHMTKKILTAALTGALAVGTLGLNGLAKTEDRFGDDPEAYGEILCGDVNRDGKLDFLDYLLLKRTVLGTYSLATVQQRQAADVNMDGVVNATDYMLLKRSILGSFGPLGIVEEELTPNAYGALTDEELYAQIDAELAADPDKEGQNLLLFRFKRIKRESQGAAVLEALGFPEDLYTDPCYLYVGHADDQHLAILMEVPEEQLREAIFKLRRCDEIGGCHTHGDQVSYPD